MGSNMHQITFIHLFYSPFCSISFLILSNSVVMADQVCHDHERSALLQFKQTFFLNSSASLHPFARPKFASWKTRAGAKTDCCLWDGVECSNVTGYVIGLDLSSSFIYGSINSSSSLFSLAHLQSLDLADNDFNYSLIPSGISRLSRLSRLNLSASMFSGKIPSEMYELSNLVSLDLAENVDRQSSQGLLTFEPYSFSSLPQNLTNLKLLNLDYVNVNSTVPETFSNLSSLIDLSLQHCALHGDFPTTIFLLPNLQTVRLESNLKLTGYLPEFNQRSNLEELTLSSTGFSGSIPASLTNLSQLTTLQLSITGFTTVGNMCWLGKLTELHTLSLNQLNLQGELLPCLANLTQLRELYLDMNSLSGPIPSSLLNLTQLTTLDLSFNQLQGPISSSFSKLKNLQSLALHYNNFSGTVEAGIFFNLTKLTQLNLSGNNISLLFEDITSANATLPKFRLLALASCNLRKFPDFLQHQDELEVLSLADNMIEHIPGWMRNRSITTVTGLENHPVLPWPNLVIIHLINNILLGSVPIPTPKISFYYVSNNRLTGSIPSSFCGLSSLSVIDVSGNNLSGTIPPCLGETSNSLTVMNLKGNSFHGTIPQACAKESNLEMMDLSQNQLEGKLPRSLINCSKLQILDLGNNKIDDSFPFWLGTLSELQVLVLSSNKLHGALTSPTYNLQFPKLHIFDVSNNYLTGSVPYEYFESWSALKIDLAAAAYMQLVATIKVMGEEWRGVYAYSMKITNKGVKREYEKILSIFIAVDLSNNKFRGEIPESIGSLKGLQSLNLSHNEFTGGIPSSTENLTQLESLDLSQNKLSGEIPPQLALLGFLAFLNVSYNNLSGIIPQGKQFNTFQNTSYLGNSALCVDPLSMQCRRKLDSPAPTTGKHSDFLYGLDWLILFSGVGSGLVVGLIFGTNLAQRNHEWFVEKFGKPPKRWQSINSVRGMINDRHN